ncbi:hypothetical protein QBE52_05600 [Clostridiaceae bacterium 35-E11]
MLVTLWIISIYFALVLSLYVNDQNIRAWIQVKKGTWQDKFLHYGQVILIAIISMLPQNVVQQEVFERYISYVGRTLTLGFIPLLVLLTVFKERKKSHGK